MKGKEEDEEKKNQKICRERTENRQTDSSNTEATLIPCGSSGERANLINYKENQIESDRIYRCKCYQ